MAEFSFHFGSPWWLLALLLIFPVGAWLRRSTVSGKIAQINRYADPHLLPHLTGSRELRTRERWRRFSRWALLWTVLVLSIAAPRWDYTQVQLFTPGADLVILLDISRSMEVSDVPPSRLSRARQEIEDLINQNHQVRVGLIAFASVAHVVTPITEDGQAIRNLLPSISSDLVRLQGSRLGQALERAGSLFAGQPKNSQHSILLISDGDFADRDLEQQVKTMAAEGVRLHVLGVGTLAGGPVPGRNERFLKNNRREVIESKLDEVGLEKIAMLGNGVYLRADYRDEDTADILELAASGASARHSGDEQVRVWNERFYWLLIPAMLMLLPLFRRHLSIDSQDQGK
ncbi:MAG: VWA domain-containing protein [Gammaproteobacteria bacterium]|nr:VWA domain-containing protein [Gammaproteobacteria bacterium]